MKSKEKKMHVCVWLVLLMLSLGLSGCGGGSGTNPVQTVSGLAAKGAAITGAEVILLDAGGNRLAGLTDENGFFSFEAGGLTPPFALQVTASDGTRYYSAALASGRVNITPLTGIIAAEAIGSSDPAAIMEKSTVLTHERFSQAQSDLKAALAPLLVAFGVQDMDLVSGAFNADSTGLDALLDVIRVKMDSAAGIVTITNSAGDQDLMVATVGGDAFVVTDSLQMDDFVHIPEIANRLYGDYHLIDFNADTADSAAEVNWGTARFSVDGWVALNLSSTNGGYSGTEKHAYTLSATGNLSIDRDAGVAGACLDAVAKSLIVVSDTDKSDGDTGIVFFTRKTDGRPAIQGTYQRMAFSRLTDGTYETGSWPASLEFTWHAEGYATYTEDGITHELRYQPDGSLTGPAGLTCFPAVNAKLLLVPHASPDDPGVSILVKSVSSDMDSLCPDSDPAEGYFNMAGMEIDPGLESSFTGESGSVRFTKTSSTEGQMSAGGVITRLIVEADGFFYNNNGGSISSHEVGIYLPEGLFIWIDKDHPSFGNDPFGCSFAFRSWLPAI